MNSVWVNDTKKYLASIDWFLIIAVLITTAYGFLLVKSATNSQPAYQATRLVTQTAAAILGFASIFILAKMDYDHLTKYSKYLYIFGVLFLALTLIIGTGDESGVGQKNWIRIPIGGGKSVGIQPSEIVKIIFIVTLAKLLDRYKEKINKPKTILFIFLHFAGMFGLIIISGDLGNGLMYACILLAMCFTAGMSLWYFLGGVFLLAASSPIWWNLMGEYQQMRIIVGFDPASYPESNYAYQVLRSMRAIGSGGLFGQGWQKGYLTQIYGGVPMQWTDFIFSAAGEEFGFLGTLLVLMLLTMIIMRVFYVSRNARNNVGSLICVGVMSMFIAQTVENVGMCIGRLPVIGVTLPFFSYGGSSILSSLLGIGLVISVNARKHIYYFTRDENIELDDF